MPGCDISQASATRAGVADVSFATLSRAPSIRCPLSLRYFFTIWPRGPFARSASERYFCGQEAAREGKITDDPDVIGDTDILQFGFEIGAVDQVVLRVHRLVARQIVFFAHGERLLEAFGAVIRGADGPHLAGLDEPVVGA